MTDHYDDLPHIARMVEDHMPPEPDRWPSGWWFLPGLAVSGVIWYIIFDLLGWL